MPTTVVFSLIYYVAKQALLLSHSDLFTLGHTLMKRIAAWTSLAHVWVVVSETYF